MHILFIFLFFILMVDCEGLVLQSNNFTDPCVNYGVCDNCLQNNKCYWCNDDAYHGCFLVQDDNKTPKCKKPNLYQQTCNDQIFSECQTYTDCKECSKALNCLWVSRGTLKWIRSNGTITEIDLEKRQICWKSLAFLGYSSPLDVSRGDDKFELHPSFQYYAQCFLPSWSVYLLVSTFVVSTLCTCCCVCCMFLCLTGYMFLCTKRGRDKLALSNRGRRRIRDKRERNRRKKKTNYTVL